MGVLFLLVAALLALAGTALGWYLETRHAARFDAAARFLRME